MCGRFDFHGKTADIAQLLGVSTAPDSGASNYNLAPTHTAMAAHIHGGDHTTRLGPMRFGMPWPHKAGLVLNARSETVQHKPMFRAAFVGRRCLVFANGFYEWEKRGAHKQPHYFTVEAQPLFAFAALYTVARDVGPSFVILTTEANETVARVHARMPVILPQNALGLWLNPATSPDEAWQLLMPYTQTPMHVRPVSPKLNSPSYQGPSCIEPIAVG